MMLLVVFGILLIVAYWFFLEMEDLSPFYVLLVGLIGIVFVLFASEKYSVDVLVATTETTRTTIEYARGKEDKTELMAIAHKIIDTNAEIAELQTKKKNIWVGLFIPKKALEIEMIK